MKKSALKTAGISMDGYRSKAPAAQAVPGPVSPPEERVRRPYTGIGLTTLQANVSHELADARQRLAEFDGASIVRALDPKTIRRSRYANRIVDEFKTEDFRKLKDEISSAGGNVQPIKVRSITPRPEVIDGQSPQYEIAFGHRRHQACLELGVPVNAIVDDDLSDAALFEAMDRENRSRKSLSAWEQGQMYHEAIVQGLYPSERRLAEALGANQSDVNRSIKLAKLPKDVVAAFSSPLDLQVRWQKPLADALQRDPDGVIERARALAKARGGRTPAQVLDRLIAKPPAQPSIVALSVSGKNIGSVRFDARGQVLVELDAGTVPASDQAALVAHVQQFFLDRQ